MGGGMSSQIMGPQIHTRKFARFFEHYASGIVRDRKNALLGLDALILDVFPQSVCNFPRDVHDFGFP